MLKKELINIFKRRCKYTCHYNFKVYGEIVDILIPEKKIIVQFLSSLSYCNNEENARIKKIKKFRNYRVITVPYYLPLSNIILKTLFNRILRYYKRGITPEITFFNIYPSKYCDSGLRDFINDIDIYWYYRNEIIECLQDAVIKAPHVNNILPFFMHPLLFNQDPRKF